MNYKLYAPESYWGYPKDLIGEIVNGCGPAGWKTRFIPDRILGTNISAACNIHDFMYHFGQTEADREEADRVFLNNLMRIVEADSRNFFTRWLRRKMVLYYYSAVRDMGGTYFWADKNSEATFKNPMEV